MVALSTRVPLRQSAERLGNLILQQDLRQGGNGLVLLDALMPGMDGFRTCQELRHLPGFENSGWFGFNHVGRPPTVIQRLRPAGVLILQALNPGLECLRCKFPIGCWHREQLAAKELLGGRGFIYVDMCQLGAKD